MLFVFFLLREVSLTTLLLWLVLLNLNQVPFWHHLEFDSILRSEN